MNDRTGDSTAATAPGATPAAAPAGWYADPAGFPGQRWWDGSQWTAHLSDPAHVYGNTPPAVGPDTPVYNPLIWLIALLPIISLVQLGLIDPLPETLFQTPARPAVLEAPYLLSNFSSLAVYAATVVLAFHDSRRLTRVGFARPFHWAWAFLHSGVYVIGRSVTVHRQTGKGLAAIWVWAVILTLATIIATIKLVELAPALLPGLSVS